MFTGIIKEIGVVEDILKSKDIIKLKVKAKNSLKDAQIGDSIAVNGVCLSIIELKEDVATFDVLPETIRLTNLEDLSVNSLVNVEESLSLQDKLGGHMVQAHVDCTVVILNIKADGEAKEITFKGAKEYIKMLVKKAYVALDGMSLTIVHVQDDTFKVMVIPHTFNHTIVKDWKIGSRVNMEVDIMNKTVYRYIESIKSNI